MRLINVHTLEFKEFTGTIPGYAILSHCWTDDEVTYKEFRKKEKLESEGFKKIKSFCDGIKNSAFRIGKIPADWVWVDTCCINKNSSAELSEAINSMYVMDLTFFETETKMLPLLDSMLLHFAVAEFEHTC